jgi:hypothetical protein
MVSMKPSTICNRSPRFSSLLLGTFCCCLAGPAVQGQIDDNLGYQWKSTAPAGYNVQLVNAKNSPVFLSTTPEILLSETANWGTLDPVSVQFVPAANPDPASPAQLDRMLLAMNIKNMTGVAWSGFRITITDNNNTDYPNLALGTGGSLLHPDRAHFHVDSLQANQLGFTAVSVIQTYYVSGNLLSTNVGLDTDKGVYSVTMTGGYTVNPNAQWQPMTYVGVATNQTMVDPTSSLLEIHDKIKTGTSFTLTFQAIAVPEPAALSLLAFGGLVILALGRGRAGRQGQNRGCSGRSAS